MTRYKFDCNRIQDSIINGITIPGNETEIKDILANKQKYGTIEIQDPTNSMKTGQINKCKQQKNCSTSAYDANGGVCPYFTDTYNKIQCTKCKFFQEMKTTKQLKEEIITASSMKDTSTNPTDKYFSKTTDNRINEVLRSSNLIYYTSDGQKIPSNPLCDISETLPAKKCKTFYKNYFYR
jgi:hypothetical protein